MIRLKSFRNEYEPLPLSGQIRFWGQKKFLEAPPQKKNCDTPPQLCTCLCKQSAVDICVSNQFFLSGVSREVCKTKHFLL